MSTTLQCPNPSNLDPLSPNGFMLMIKKLPELSFFAQKGIIPAVSVASIRVPTSLVDLQTPSNKMVFSPLEVEFQVDSQMANYKAIFEWLEGMGRPEEHQQAIDWMNLPKNDNDLRDSKLLSPATMFVLGANNQPVQAIEYIDLFPVSLSALSFATTNKDVVYLTGKATFAYTYYKFV